MWGGRLPGILSGLVCAVAVLVLGWVWAIASPPSSSPDEEYHLASIWCPTPYQDYGCQVRTDGHGRLTVDVPESIGVDSLCWRALLKSSAACAHSLSQEVQVPTWRVDQGAYPGGMYKVMHLLVGEDVYQSLLAQRMLTVVIAVLFGAGVVIVGGRSVGRQLAYVVLGSYLPLGVSLVASVNPSGWSLIGVTTAFLAMVSLAYADRRWRVVGSIALVAGGALVAGVARTDAGPFLVAAGAAVVVIYHRQFRRHLLRLLVPALLGVWGLIVLFSASQVAAIQSPAAAAGIDVSRRNARLTFVQNLEDVLGLVAGNYGSWPLAQLDAPMPSLVHVPALLVAGGICLYGLRQATIGKLLAVTTIMVVVVALPLYLLQVTLLRVGEVVQPRYLLPLLPVLVGCCVAPVFGRQLCLTRAQALGVWAAVSLAHCSALLAYLRRFASGVDGPFFLGDPNPWTWPGGPAPVVLWAVGTIAFAVAAFAVVIVSDGSDQIPERVAPVPQAVSPAPEVPAGAAQVAPGDPAPVSSAEVTEPPTLPKESREATAPTEEPAQAPSEEPAENGTADASPDPESRLVDPADPPRRRYATPTWPGDDAEPARRAHPDQFQDPQD